MPRLNKIRITGNRYDGFKKQYRNSIFSLESKHTLFTLQNGSGKGAMLQLIFQLLLPGTAWGSQNGNQLENMFYNRYGEFRQYTFHVVLEWSLEGSENKKLLSGICVSANQHKLAGEEELKIGLKYFLYTHQYQNRSQFSLKNLPLYQEEKDKVLQYDEMEKFVDQNKAELVKYYKSSVSTPNSEYYQYLSSHGIYRSEWEIMKNINRSEGALERHFAKAKDNQALFDQIIIPAVSESISYHDQGQKKSLINLFINNIEIAQNLPELLSRADDLKKLDYLVEPLLKNSQKGLRLQNTKAMIRERGNNYLRGIETRLSFLENELSRSQAEKVKTKKSIKNLKFEAENLKYVKKLRELKKLQTNLESSLIKKSESEKNLAEIKAEKLHLKLNQKYIKFEKLKTEIEQQKIKIDLLKKRPDFNDLEIQIKDLKKEIAAASSDLNTKIKKSFTAYYSYHNYLIKELKRMENKEDELEQQFRSKQKIKIDYEQQARNLTTEKNKLARFFNSLELETPAYLLQNLENEEQKLDSNLEEIEENLKAETKAAANFLNQKHQVEIKLAKQKSQVDNLQISLKDQKEAEEDLYLKILKSLNLDQLDEFYSKKWLQQKNKKILQLIKAKEKRLQKLSAKSFELQLDLNLNDQEYWIASLEQKQLYQKIKELDISVYYGSQFLLEMVEDRQKYLNDYPLLPYGLVIINQLDWKKIKDNISPTQIFHSAVPIFINNQLDQVDFRLPFKLVTGQEKNFMKANKNFQDWSQALKDKESEFQATITILKNKLKKLKKINYQAEAKLQKKSASDLKIELETAAVELENLEKEIKNLADKIKIKNKKISDLKQKYTKTENKLKKLKDKKQKVNRFLEANKNLETKKARYQKTLAELENLDQLIWENKNKWRRIHENKLQLNNDYQQWSKKYYKFSADLKQMLEKEAFKLKTDFKAKDLNLFASPEYPDFYNFEQHHSYQKYERIIQLKEKEAEKEADLKYLELDLKNKSAELDQLRNELAQLAADWEQREYSFKNLRQIEFALAELKTQLNKIEAETEALKKDIIIKKTKLQEKKEHLRERAAEIKARFHCSVKNWENIELKPKKLEIKNQLKENKEYLFKLENMISNYQEKLGEYREYKGKLDYYELNSDKGELNAGVKADLKDSPAAVVNDWIADYRKNKAKIKSLREKIENNFYQFKNDVQVSLENNYFKNKVKENLLQNFKSNAYQYNLEALNNFKEYINHALNDLSHARDKAEEARNYWAERSALHVMRLINSMQDMISKMVYYNQKGIAFPLVKLRRTDLLPDDKEEIIFELRQYFLELITKFKEQDIEIEKLSESKLEKYCGDTALFSRALRGRYPVLQVYKMTEKNEFLYAKPQSYFYSDWESVIKGKGKATEGSGGQSLSINAFMMMMLLNYKKQNLARTNPWTTLFLDNPFGKASAAHVLDPVFKIADKLHFQLIAFAAPEIIKSEISERFPVFWALEVAHDDQNRGTIAGELVSGARKRKLD